MIPGNHLLLGITAQSMTSRLQRLSQVRNALSSISALAWSSTLSILLQERCQSGPTSIGILILARETGDTKVVQIDIDRSNT